VSGWGSGNKEWSLNLPEGEESECLAAGDNFVAVATSRRNLRIFMIGGTQREILALPGPVVAMNGLGNHLVIAYHAGIGKKIVYLVNIIKKLYNLKNYIYVFKSVKYSFFLRQVQQVIKI